MKEPKLYRLIATLVSALLIALVAKAYALPENAQVDIVLEPINTTAKQIKAPTKAVNKPEKQLDPIKDNPKKCNLTTQWVWQDFSCHDKAVALDKVDASPTPEPVVASPVGNIEQIIRQAAVKHGLNPDHFVSIARCESGLNPQAVNNGYYENGNPSGLFQHLSGYWAGRASAHGYAGASVFDPVANANVTASMWASGSSNLWECQ